MDRGNTASVKALLDVIDNASDINVRSDFSRTSLSIAIRLQRTQMGQLLLNTGYASVNAVNVSGQSPVLWAAKRGVNVDADKADKFGITPLMCAAGMVAML